MNTPNPQAKKKIYSKEDVKALFQILHFCEGLEDVNYLYMLEPKALERWCKNIGTKLHYISFALAMEGDIKFILNKLKEENE